MRSREEIEAYLKENAEKIKEKIKRQCLLVGRFQEWEDAYQAYMVTVLEGKSLHQIIPHWFYDYSEKQKWTTRSKIGIPKSLEFEEKNFPHVDSYEEYLGLESFVETLKDKRRVTFILNVIWGLSLTEVSYVLGLSLERVFQMQRDNRENFIKSQGVKR